MILPLPLPRFFWPYILAGTVTLGLVAAIFFIDRDRDYWRDSYDALKEETGVVLIALRGASENQDVTWKTAPGQIVALGEAHKKARETIGTQNQEILEMVNKQKDAVKRAKLLRRELDKQQALRRAALVKLGEIAITPGEREDCLLMLEEVNLAIEAIKEVGKAGQP